MRKPWEFLRHEFTAAKLLREVEEVLSLHNLYQPRRKHIKPTRTAMWKCNDKGKIIAVNYINACGKLEVQHPSILTSALLRNRWSAWHPDNFIFLTHWIKAWVVLTAGPLKRKIPQLSACSLIKVSFLQMQYWGKHSYRRHLVKLKKQVKLQN
jgi:hypothetical protein